MGAVLFRREMGEDTLRRARREPHSGKRRPVWTASPQKTGPKWICKGLVDLSTISNGSTKRLMRTAAQLQTHTGKYPLLSGLVFFIELMRVNH